MSSVTERGLQANGLAFNVAEAGDGPPVLLLPGSPSRRWPARRWGSGPVTTSPSPQ
jgi:hypothetical protein